MLHLYLKRLADRQCVRLNQTPSLGRVLNFPPGEIVSKHIHKDISEIFLVQKGEGEIEIDGDTYENPMPPQEENLNDQQIADVLTYVRNSFGNKATPILPAEVKKVRAALKGQ